MAAELSEYTVAGHLEKSDPIVRKIYSNLLTALRKFGPVHEAAKKTCIHLDNKSGFAGVFLRKNYINLNIRTDYKITSPRAQKTEQVSKSRYHQTIKLAFEADIDKELLGWLKDAYNLNVK